MKSIQRIEAGARARIDDNRREILHSARMVQDGNPLGAEPETPRLLRRLQRKAMLSRAEADVLVDGIQAREVLGGRRTALAVSGGAEKVWGKTIDFVGVAFFEQGRSAARAVARVATRDGRAIGSGFLVSDRLFLTNNHVIPTPGEGGELVIELDYELDGGGNPIGVTRFALDPSAFFLTDGEDDLDYTLIAVGARLSGTGKLQDFGWCPLSDAGDKHALGEVANIVQHPDGRFKEVVLRENRLVSRLEHVLHYDADTEPGASGSPVFNNEWHVIALHHWGGPWRQKVDEQGQPAPTEINEGIRASAIVGELRTRLSELTPERRALLQEVVRIGEAQRRPPGDGRHAGEGRENGGARIEADGRVTWRVPVEISVRLPGLVGADAPAPRPAPVAAAPANGDLPGGERKVALDKDYDNRRGYNPRFIEGFRIDLPELGVNAALAAENREAGPGEDPHELKYQHFSAVVNRERKLALFTACNIDGTTAKTINRQSGDISNREPGGGGGESLAESAEASETWFADPRLAPLDAATQKLYAKQVVAGHDTGTKGWMDRMLQRGHLVRRLDPVWGKEKNARRAEADTFHFVNCTPQVGFFNMGTAPKSKPYTGGGLLWRAIEDYVLDNAVDEQERVCVFTGPVLDDKDPPWRGHVIPSFRVPMRFWKIVAWAAGGKLHAVAMLADQRPVLKVLPEAIPGGEAAEAFIDVSKVADFVTTVAEIEQLTGLDFGKELRDADAHKGGGEGKGGKLRPVLSFEEVLGAPRKGALAASGGRRTK